MDSETNTEVALGYCSGCRMPVELNAEMRCPFHPGRTIMDVRLATLWNIETTKSDILFERSRRIRRQLIGWLIGINSFLLLGYVLFFLLEI